MPATWGHVAVTRSSENGADRFFRDLLGLEKTRSRSLPAEIGARIFGRPGPCQMIDYRGRGVRVEVFVPEQAEVLRCGYAHLCLVVEDREALLARCPEASVTVVRVPHGSSDIVFLEDEDGNRYEIQAAT